MKKQAKNQANLKTTQTKFEDAINKQIDKTIDKIVDNTFENIEKQEKQEKEILKKTEKNAEKSMESKKDEKIIFGVSYFLFFISLIFSKSDERKFYANQGLVLLIFGVVGAIFFRFVIGLIHYETSIILSMIFYVFILLFATYGLVKTLLGEKFVLIPLIGKIKLIK